MAVPHRRVWRVPLPADKTAVDDATAPRARNARVRGRWTAIARFDDWSGHYSDRRLDALVAWGTIEQCVARLHRHRYAGADHVACLILGTETLDEDLAPTAS